MLILFSITIAKEISSSAWKNIIFSPATGKLIYADYGEWDTTPLPTGIDLWQIAKKFLEENANLLGLTQEEVPSLPHCFFNTPPCGSYWVEVPYQTFNGFIVENTGIRLRIDYPGEVREVRCFWYPEIKLGMLNCSFLISPVILPYRENFYLAIKIPWQWQDKKAYIYLDAESGREITDERIKK